MRAKPPLIMWASRGAGIIGIVTAILGLGLSVGGGESAGELIGVGVLFLVMLGAGLLAWFADRQPPMVGRRMVWAAFAAFFILGVLSIFTVGLLYLLASVLAVFSLSQGSRAPVGRPTDSSSE